MSNPQWIVIMGEFVTFGPLLHWSNLASNHTFEGLLIDGMVELNIYNMGKDYHYSSCNI